MQLLIKFEGGLARENKIPAYEGTKSLEGLTRTIQIVSNFLVEGRVRRRDFERVPIAFNLVAHRPGSFEAVYEIAYAVAVIGGPIAGGLAAGVAGNLLTDLLKVVYRRATGSEVDDPPAQIERLEEDRGGDVSALVEAVEPALRLGHNVINHGVINININHGPQEAPQPIVELNSHTKTYMWENVINNTIRAKLFSIASFNANQATGRAFDLEEGRSVPFELAQGVDRQSIETLIASISSYARRRRLGDDIRSAVALRYTSVEAPDGRIKKIRVLTVRPEIADFQ